MDVIMGHVVNLYSYRQLNIAQKTVSRWLNRRPNARFFPITVGGAAPRVTLPSSKINCTCLGRLFLFAAGGVFARSDDIENAWGAPRYTLCSNRRTNSDADKIGALLHGYFNKISDVCSGSREEVTELDRLRRRSLTVLARTVRAAEKMSWTSTLLGLISGERFV
jgi:hypothetical protein